MGRKILVDADALLIRVKELVELSNRLGWYTNSLVHASWTVRAKEKLSNAIQKFEKEIEDKPTFGEHL